MFHKILSPAAATLLAACCCYICGCTVAHFHAEASITVDDIAIALPDLNASSPTSGSP